MDAALITRMFNFGCNVKKEPPKDVLAKKNSDFKDVLSKNVKDVKNEDSKVSKDVNKEDKEKIKTNKDEKADEKEVKRKDKKDDKNDDKKIKDSEENETEKINGLIEQRLENAKNIQDLDINVEDVEKIEFEVKDVVFKDELKEGLGENIDEVGPQSVETEKIELNEFDKLESKLDSLSEKLGRTNTDDNDIKLDNEEETPETEEEDYDVALSNIEDVNYKESEKVESKDVRDRVNRFKMTDLRENRSFNNEFKMTGMDVKNENIEIPKFDVTNTNNIVLSKADKLQEQIDVLKQITEKVEVNLLEDKSEILIKLKPDNLGKVTMQISVENGNISAKFLAESQKVKEILESNMQELKEQLAKQGMAVQDLSVSVGNDNRERQMFEGRNFGTFNRHSRINRVKNTSYSIDGEIYDDAINENIAHYWPDSTVSFSA